MIHLNAPTFDALGAYIASTPSESFVYIPVEVARDIVGGALLLGGASQRCVRCGSRSLCVCLCVRVRLCVSVFVALTLLTLCVQVLLQSAAR